MRTLLVSFCLVCTAFAAWEQSDEWSLPKGVQVNDLAISNTGELYLLSNSSVLKYESSAKNALLIASVEGSKVLSIHDGTILVVDGSNRLVEIDLDNTETSTSARLPLSMPSQLRHVSFNKKPYIIVNEKVATAVLPITSTSILDSSYSTTFALSQKSLKPAIIAPAPFARSPNPGRTMTMSGCSTCSISCGRPVCHDRLIR